MNPAQVCLTQRTGNYADAQETRTGRLLCSAVVGEIFVLEALPFWEKNASSRCHDRVL